MGCGLKRMTVQPKSLWCAEVVFGYVLRLIKTWRLPLKSTVGNCISNFSQYNWVSHSTAKTHQKRTMCEWDFEGRNFHAHFKTNGNYSRVYFSKWDPRKKANPDASNLPGLNLPAREKILFNRFSFHWKSLSNGGIWWDLVKICTKEKAEEEYYLSQFIFETISRPKIALFGNIFLLNLAKTGHWVLSLILSIFSGTNETW